MVQSILDKSINYIEIPELADDDNNYEAVAYDIILKDKKRRLALGKP